MSPMRRDALGRPQAGPTWESMVERLIREAAERDEFDDHAYSGRRLPVQDEQVVDDEHAAANIVLRNARAVPPWIDADREFRALLASRDALLEQVRRSAGRRTPSAYAIERDGRELRALVEAANGAILRLDLEAPTPHQQRHALSLDDELAALAAAHGGRAREHAGPG